jgi:hypothetical protein
MSASPPPWAKAFLLVNRLAPAAALAPATARVLKKSLLVRGWAKPSTPGTLIVFFSIIATLLP